MSWLDVVLLLLLVVSVVTSLRKGLSREVIGLVSGIVALFAGLWFYGTAGSFIQPYTSSRAIANFAGFVLVFGLVLLLGAVVSFAVGRFLKVTRLSIVDHLLGAGFGLVRGVLLGVALLVGLMAFTPGDQPPPAVVKSRLAPYVVDGARVIASMAPHELKQGFRKTYAQVKTAWSKTFDKGVGGSDAGKGQHERKI